jgi:uncharacterized protein (DUF1697 family)
MLRGVNVAGQKKIPMEALRRLYASLGVVNIRTYIQSGNVVFDSGEADAALLAIQIETKIEGSLGFSVTVFIRPAQDFQRVIARNPFLTQRQEDPSKLHVTFLYEPPSEAKLNILQNPGSGTDEFIGGVQEIFLFCPNGYGKTKLNNGFFERQLGTPATTRNWNTVNALNTMARER